MDEIKLKPCPFCGGEAKAEFAKAYFLKKELHNHFVFVGCPQCGAATALFNAYNWEQTYNRNEANEKAAFQNAANAWNRRANDG